MEMVLILLLAVLLDVTLGDPPNAFHPVAWMGKVASFIEKGCPSAGNLRQFLYGIILTLVTMEVFALPVYLLFHYIRDINTIVYVIIGALLFKFTFSLRGLRKAALTVKKLLLGNKLDEARFELRALVKRDTSGLAQPLLVSATVESVAENLTDSFVAPLFYFLLLGIPGAFAYRVVNTLDAMIGYHGKYEYLGKFASRLDTVLNYLPARIAALLIIFAAWLSRRNARQSWQVALKEHGKTASPNAGWTMAATAGALNVRLEKVGYYKLGERNPLPTVAAIDASLNLIQIAALTWTVFCLAGEVIYFVVTT